MIDWFYVKSQFEVKLSHDGNAVSLEGCGVHAQSVFDEFSWGKRFENTTFADVGLLRARSCAEAHGVLHRGTEW
jgi:hypothetical protein